MSDLDLLKGYLQDKIDIGVHKMFTFDKDDNFIEFKTIDALNEINNLEQQLQQKENIINEFDKWLDDESEKTILSTGHLTCLMMCKNKLKELKGDSNNE